MLAPSKRRHVSLYLSLPLVIAIVFLLVAQLVAMQRTDIIAELADRIAHRDTQDAAAAVRQLAAMSRPPVTILVAAAASADREVAGEAQQAINKLLRRCERQMAADRSIRAVARQLAALAEALAAQTDAFSTVDYPWLANTSQKILSLANQVPSKRTPLVATHCDAILATITPAGPPHVKVANNESNMSGPVGSAAKPPAQSPDSEQTHLQRAFAAAANSQLEAAVATEPIPITVEDSEHGTDTPSNDPMDSSWRAGWSHPMFRIPSAMPINALPIDGSPRLSDPSLPEPKEPPSDAEITDFPLAGVASHTLLQNWLAAEGPDVAPLEQELTRRGFGRLSERLVQQLFAEVSEDRLRLVNDVLTEPGVDARPWLMMLADDADADVRLLAVTSMATSNDATLVEKAWQTAIRDRDPRIAGLADRLRERRAAVQRR